MSVIVGLALIAVTLLVAVVAVYPGELSYFGRPLHRWLYDRSADSYERKWDSPAYRDRHVDELVARTVRLSCERSGRFDVLDLGCGTGRATRLAAGALPAVARFVAVDFAPGMLDRFRRWLDGDADAGLRQRVEIVCSDVGEWLRGESAGGCFGVVLLLEAAEFLPDLAAVLRDCGRVTAPGGGLIMTRPAGFWWLLFPGRHQSRAALDRLLRDSGFDAPSFVPWRFRYEVVVARKPA